MEMFEQYFKYGKIFPKKSVLFNKEYFISISKIVLL